MMIIDKDIDAALADPALLAALKKDFNDMDYKDKDIIDATKEYVGKLLIMITRDKMLDC